MSNKRRVYPIVMTPSEEGGYCVTIPDFGTHTQGDDLADALSMAQDSIEMMGVYLQDDKQTVPEPRDIESITVEDGDIKSLVAVDFDAYRRKTEKKLVKKTLSIPSWLNVEAEKAKINFSATLQDALKEILGVE